MTRYPTDHKANTRTQLLDAARTEFRENGFEATSIDRLTQAAGLTRGGFYAHFKSKEALVREVLRLEPGLLRELRRLSADEPGRQTAARLFDDYLDPEKRDDLLYCPLVAHPLDALRGGDARRSLYAEQITGLITKLDELLDVSSAADRDREAILVAVLAVGAAILSSTMPDQERADRIEEVCRTEIRRRLVGDA